jgi:Tfp pilus assembly protein PilF
MTDSLAWHTYRYDRLLEGEPAVLDPSVQVQARALSYPFTALGFAYAERGDAQRALANLERANQLANDPAVKSAYDQVRARLFQMQGDTSRASSVER